MRKSWLPRRRESACALRSSTPCTIAPMACLSARSPLLQKAPTVGHCHRSHVEKVACGSTRQPRSRSCAHEAAAHPSLLLTTSPPSSPFTTFGRSRDPTRWTPWHPTCCAQAGCQLSIAAEPPACCQRRQRAWWPRAWLACCRALACLKLASSGGARPTFWWNSWRTFAATASSRPPAASASSTGATRPSLSSSRTACPEGTASLHLCARRRSRSESSSHAAAPR